MLDLVKAMMAIFLLDGVDARGIQKSCLVFSGPTHTSFETATIVTNKDQLEGLPVEV